MRNRNHCCDENKDGVAIFSGGADWSIEVPPDYIEESPKLLGPIRNCPYCGVEL